MNNDIIIIGGGCSINNGIDLGLKNYLKDKFVIACNYAYKHFDHTFMCFTDRDFYRPRPDKDNPNIYNELKQLPLIIGINNNGIEEFKLDNTILLDKKYRTNLTGVFALSLAEKLIDKGTIYLLGFDWSRQPIPKDKNKYNSYSNLDIHYYKKEIQHRGTGCTGYYDRHNPDKEFIKLIKKDIKIFNVSLNSNISCFPKISYKTMFKMLNSTIYNQNELRITVKNKLNLLQKR